MFNSMRIQNPSYVDVGANDPIKLSNTYAFYCSGSKGVCIEANVTKAELFASVRPRDEFVNIGVAPEPSAPLDFYILSNDVLSTLDATEAKRLCEEDGETIERVVQVPVMTLNKIINEHCSSTPDFVSLDVEGLDNAILATFDFDQCRPLAWCLETISYSATGLGVKDTQQREVLERSGYVLYADTYINSIFVDKKRWVNRHNNR